jgi:hypothetical protein
METAMDEMTGSEVKGSPPAPTGGGRRRWLYAGGLLAAGTLLGGILAGTMAASAAESGSSATPTAATAPTAPAAPSAPPGFGGSASAPNARSATPVRPDEKALSATDAAKVKAAALKAVPGGTVFRVETDAGDGVYEAHMSKADGTLVTVKLDASFAVTAVEPGMGSGDPALQPPSSGSPSSSGTTSSSTA